MKWVTWEHVGVDRMACAWLIRSRIDPQAEFTFVPVGSLPLPAGMEPFDLPGVRFGHHHGRCSFVSFLKEYQFQDPVLERIGRLIDEADIVQDVALEPAAPGLDLICRGLSRTSRDDYEAIDRGYLVYDGLYAELSAEST